MQARKASTSPFQRPLLLPIIPRRKHVPNHHDLVLTHSVDYHVQCETVPARSCVRYVPFYPF